ncbi:MAG: ATP-dependent zinc protease [Bacterioplanes sp.]|nr:ATP-dependent zinc protease [Bacterioplanes sp.]
MTKTTVGYIETVELPELAIQCDAKIDTGACTSSLHAEQIELIERNGAPWVRFHVLFDNEVARIDQVCEAPLIDQRRIASSNGARSKRYIIRSTLKVGGQERTIEISLSHRGSMRYPMLIGRKALSGQFIVDVEHAYIGTPSL